MDVSVSKNLNLTAGEMDNQRIVKGIAAYKREQHVLLRLLRKRGAFTEQEFDGWFRGREYRRPVRFGLPLTGDTFILGFWKNGGNSWALMLDLMQQMMALGLVDARRVNGSVVYTLGPIAL